MTTLSKEDVVRAAFEAWFDPDDNGTHWHTFRDAYELGEKTARADIVEANKSLVAENERMKSYFSEERGKLLGTANTIDRLTDQLINQLTATRTALAAAEAREAKFIAALDQAESALSEIRDFPLTYLEVSEALSQPRDDSALRRLLAEAKAGVYEECAKVCENSDRYRGDYFAAKIRELAEKAKEEKC